MHATHTQTYSKDRLLFLEYTSGGTMALFEKIDCPYLTRITCPMHPKFVLPYKERSEIESNPSSDINFQNAIFCKNNGKQKYFQFLPKEHDINMDALPIENREKAYNNLMAGGGESLWAIKITEGSHAI